MCSSLSRGSSPNLKAKCSRWAHFLWKMLYEFIFKFSNVSNTETFLSWSRINQTNKRLSLNLKLIFASRLKLYREIVLSTHFWAFGCLFLEMKVKVLRLRVLMNFFLSIKLANDITDFYFHLTFSLDHRKSIYWCAWRQTQKTHRCIVTLLKFDMSKRKSITAVKPNGGNFRQQRL